MTLIADVPSAGCVLAEPAPARASSPLRANDEVEVVDIASDEHKMFVVAHWEERTLAVPLIQLEVLDADGQTRQAVEDWHYWIERGYTW